MFAQGVDLTKTMFAIAAGKSDIAPDGRDPRLKHDAWIKNPAYKRLAQTYVATTQAVEKMIPDDLTSRKPAAGRTGRIDRHQRDGADQHGDGQPGGDRQDFRDRQRQLDQGARPLSLTISRTTAGCPGRSTRSRSKWAAISRSRRARWCCGTRLFELIHYIPSTARGAIKSRCCWYRRRSTATISPTWRPGAASPNIPSARACSISPSAGAIPGPNSATGGSTHMPMPRLPRSMRWPR